MRFNCLAELKRKVRLVKSFRLLSSGVNEACVPLMLTSWTTIQRYFYHDVSFYHYHYYSGPSKYVPFKYASRRTTSLYKVTWISLILSNAWHEWTSLTLNEEFTWLTKKKNKYLADGYAVARKGKIFLLNTVTYWKERYLSILTNL